MSRIPTITTNTTAASVNGSDAGTHERLDIINDTIINKHLDRATDSVDISGQTIQVNGLTGVARESTLSNINENIPTMSSDNGNRLLVNTDGQSVGITNFPANQTVNVVSGSINVNNFPSTQQVFGSVNVSNMISGFATETTSNAIKSAINNKRLQFIDDSVSVTGSSVNISNPITLTNNFTLDGTTQTTNTKLDTLNTSVVNKHLDKTSDSVDITNQNVNVNQNIEGSNYDLILQGSTLWADTTPVTNSFFADPLGREGWYYGNLGNIANKSNIYWYANPTGGNLQENDMTFSQLSCFYSVLTCDYVDDGSLTIPVFSVYSQPTGTNDIIPTFAHSRWAYSVSNVDRPKFRKGETVLLYSGTARPDVFNQLPAYNLVLASATGDALPSEIIAYMSVNTQATTSTIGYLLQYVGYLNSAVGHIKQYGFKNSKERLAQSNLASLTITDGVLSVSGSGGGSGGNVTVDNISSTPLITGFALETGGNLASIKTNSDKNKYNGDNLNVKYQLPQHSGQMLEMVLGLL